MAEPSVFGTDAWAFREAPPDTFDSLEGYLSGHFRWPLRSEGIYICELKNHPDVIKIGITRASSQALRFSDPEYGKVLYFSCQDGDLIKQLPGKGDLPRAEAWLREKYLGWIFNEYRESIDELRRKKWSGRTETFRVPKESTKKVSTKRKNLGFRESIAGALSSFLSLENKYVEVGTEKTREICIQRLRKELLKSFANPDAWITMANELACNAAERSLIDKRLEDLRATDFSSAKNCRSQTQNTQTKDVKKVSQPSSPNCTESSNINENLEKIEIARSPAKPSKELLKRFQAQDEADYGGASSQAETQENKKNLDNGGPLELTHDLHSASNNRESKHEEYLDQPEQKVEEKHDDWEREEYLDQLRQLGGEIHDAENRKLFNDSQSATDNEASEDFEPEDITLRKHEESLGVFRYEGPDERSTYDADDEDGEYYEQLESQVEIYYDSNELDHDSEQEGDHQCDEDGFITNPEADASEIDGEPLINPYNDPEDSWEKEEYEEQKRQLSEYVDDKEF